MKRLILPAIAACVFAVACADTKTSPQEEAEIKTMDSVSAAVKDSTRKLEDQTKKVEASLEKLDESFENAQNK